MSASLELPTITDEDMRQGLATLRGYAMAVLKKGPAYNPPNSDPLIWEHGRRNFALRAAGLLSIVCPVVDKSEYAGVSIFNADPSRVQQIMAEDPAVKADVLSFEVHPVRSFPGDTLPDSA